MGANAARKGNVVESAQPCEGPPEAWLVRKEVPLKLGWQAAEHQGGAEVELAMLIPVSAGVHTGVAFVGAVGDNQDITDFTALGDALNTTARLASVASAGELLVTSPAAEAAALQRGGLEQRRISLRGRTVPVDVLVLGAAPSTLPPSDTA